MRFSPHVVSRADAALSRVIAETSKTPAASQYWERKRPLFRQLALRVVEAMEEGLGKDQAVAQSVADLRRDVLERAETSSARQAFEEWFERRAGFLSGVAKRLWAGTLRMSATKKPVRWALYHGHQFVAEGEAPALKDAKARAVEAALSERRHGKTPMVYAFSVWTHAGRCLTHFEPLFYAQTDAVKRARQRAKKSG